MKWPSSIMLVRHDTSAYNILKDRKKGDPLYEEFLTCYEDGNDQEKMKRLAVEVQKKFSLGMGDANTPLADEEGRQAYEVGLHLSSGEVPDVIFVSPYKRALLTLEHMTRGWPALAEVKTYKDDRIREQEHGLALIYNDWKILHVLHPEQKALFEIEGPYWYRYPQGESVSDVRDRNRAWLSTIIRDFPQKKILVVTHHLNILATRANLERWDADQFMHIDKTEKPINCGVTVYRGHPELGTNGKLLLESYNEKYYK